MAEGKGEQNVCVTNVTGVFLSCKFCGDPLLPLLCSGTIRKVTFGGKCFQTYFCHTRFAVVFPSPSSCISSLLSTDQFTVVGLVP